MLNIFIIRLSQTAIPYCGFESLYWCLPWNDQQLHIITHQILRFFVIAMSFITFGVYLLRVSQTFECITWMSSPDFLMTFLFYRSAIFDLIPISCMSGNLQHERKKYTIMFWRNIQLEHRIHRFKFSNMRVVKCRLRTRNTFRCLITVCIYFN